MTTTKVSARWTGEKLNYTGIDSKGRTVLMGGEHTSPGQLLLIAVAGCMGMDVISILKKKQQLVTDLEVEITGYQPDEYPRPFQTVEIMFNVKGNNVDPLAVARSIELSETKYCIVGKTLMTEVDLKTSYRVNA